MDVLGSVLVIGVVSGAIYGLFALGLVLVYKTSRVLNLAQAEIGGLAAFVTLAAVDRIHVWPLAAAIGLAVSCAVGLGFERAIVRPLLEAPRLTLVVATLSAGLLIGGLETKIWGVDARALPTPFHFRGPSLAGVVVPPARLVALGASIVVAGAAAWFMRSTTLGLGLRAAADDPVAVRLTGVRVRHLSALTWAASSLFGGMAGIVIALSLGAFAPFFMTRLMLLGFAAAVVGGLTSLVGALTGGIVVGVLEAVVARYWISVPGAVEVAMLAAIVAFLLLRPRGMFGQPA